MGCASALGPLLAKWPEVTFVWNAEQMQFEGDSDAVREANEAVAPMYRVGWEVPAMNQD